MKWTFNTLGLQAPLTWAEWWLLVCVFIILIFAGWELIQFIKWGYKVMRGE